ncbi:MAG: TPM domain-containing protein [Victivallaceae bacterium]|nr:TPM domain-containing protein [Victivallaceae bacterium]
MKIIKTICITMLCLLALTSNAKLQVPELTSRVVDNANILTASQKVAVEFAIQQLEYDTGGQLAVLIIPSLQGDNLEEFSLRVAEQWQIGYKGKDNGVILLISQADRKIRLEVGSGWDEIIDNAQAKAIIDKMGIFFRDGKFTDGIIVAINTIHNALPRNTKTASRIGKEPESSTSIWSNLIGMSALLMMLMGIFFCFKYGTGNDTATYSGSNSDHGYNRGRYFNAHSHGSSGFYGGSSSGGFSGGGSSGGGGGFSGGGGGGFSGGGASGGW